MVGGAGVVAGLVLCNIVVVKIQTSQTLHNSYIGEAHPVAHGGPGEALVVDELPGKLAPLEHLACRDTGGLQLQVRFVHLLQQQEAEQAAQSVSFLRFCCLTQPLSIFI